MGNKTLNDRIRDLQNVIVKVQVELDNLSDTVKSKSQTPYSKLGQGTDKSTSYPISPNTGLSGTFGGKVMWNDVEITRPRLGEKPTNRPKTGYCRHAHSRYAGGALDINSVELVEYNVPLNGTWEGDVPNLKEWNSSEYSKHCQDFWPDIPPIATSQNSNRENIKKIGTLDAIFNADTRKWGMATYEIDVEKCYLIMRDSNGDIQRDAFGNEMKAPMYNADSTKSNIVWDTQAQVWRFFAVYSD